MTGSEYDVLAAMLTDAFVAGRKSGYREGLIDCGPSDEEVEKRVEMLFGSDDEQTGARSMQ